MLIITADHGCDPAFPGTDHTREYIPVIIYGKDIKPINIGTRSGFSDNAATAAQYLGTDYSGSGESFLEEII